MKIITEEYQDWFYMDLNMYKKGIVDRKKLMEDDLIFDVRDNGIIVLVFKYNRQYFELFDLSKHDINDLERVYSVYSSLEFTDSYTATQDWDEGYLFYYFNGENENKINEILNFLNPSLDITHRGDKKEIAELLHNMFEREVNDIIGDYSSEMDNAIQKAVEAEIEGDLCKIFEEDGIYNSNDSCFYKYFTTVDNLIKLYDELNVKNLSLYGMLQHLGHTKSVQGGYIQDYYDSDYTKHFDSESFNRYCDRYLDQIKDKILDSDVFKNIDEYKNIIDKIGKFKFGSWHDLPKDKSKMFKIIRVVPETNEIEIEVKYKVTKSNKIDRGTLNFENFNNLLYHPELF